MKNRLYQPMTAIAPEGKKVASVGLGYSVSNPLVIEFSVFYSGETSVRLIGRDLLAEGTRRQVGEGDIIVLPCQYGNITRLSITLMAVDPQDRNLVLLLSEERVQNFLAETAKLVPFGDESQHLDLDGELAELLGGAR